jgi:hypothetical protein
MEELLKAFPDPRLVMEYVLLNDGKLHVFIQDGVCCVSLYVHEAFGTAEAQSFYDALVGALRQWRTVATR